MQQEPARHISDLHDVEPPPRLAGVQKDVTLLEGTGGSQDQPLDISHELRTSLAIITLLSGNLDLLYERLEDDERQRMIRGIRKHTQKVNNLVGDVLELCNDTGHSSMQGSRVNLAQQA